jgi:hypothetical protein
MQWGEVVVESYGAFLVVIMFALYFNCIKKKKVNKQPEKRRYRA